MTGTLQGYPHTRVNGAAKCPVMRGHGLGHIIVRLCRPAKCVCYDLGVGTGKWTESGWLQLRGGFGYTPQVSTGREWLRCTPSCERNRQPENSKFEAKNKARRHTCINLFGRSGELRPSPPRARSSLREPLSSPERRRRRRRSRI